MSATTTQRDEPLWWALPADDVLDHVDATTAGLSGDEASSRLARYGPNQLEAKKSASWYQLAFKQVVDPMNLMLLAVTAVSLGIGQIPTGVLVGLLVLFNVWSGAAQEAKAQASVDALATMQVPTVRTHRDGEVAAIPAVDLVPGDVIELEAGDIVPADARVLRASSLETQESALTGESAAIEKRADPTDREAVLGDRTSMLFQNTSVTRGTATAVVVSTGMSTEMGAIATMLADVERVASPLQQELSGLTRVIGSVAWGAVLVIIVLGVTRGQSFADLMFLGTAVAISAIPTGMPTFVQQMLAWGANQLTDAKAIVASLNDVETLGATSAICSDKTGTLTMNEMTAREAWFGGRAFTIDGHGYSFEGTIRREAGAPVEETPAMAYALALPNDATVSPDGDVVGDPTEAAFVVFAEKLGVDVPATHRRFPRLAEVPFDSDHKFMATFHRIEWEGAERLAVVVKGAPDVILQRSATFLEAESQSVVPIDTRAQDVTDQIEGMSERGLRTLSLAIRLVDPADEDAALADPMAAVRELTFMGVVGIVDPLRPAAKVAVQQAQAAGIEVRMITGDHVVTAQAIGADLGLQGSALTGAEFAAMSDDEVDADLERMSVFGRVTPQDKLRLVRRLQARGDVVAMTGDAVNDAAAIKQAQIGVAMGSGSEVTKQAAKLVLTDDNFATLVNAVRLGRVVYQKILNFITFQMSQLIALISLFLAASVFNINDGMALTPIMALALNFAIVLFCVLTIIADPAPEGLMERPPRDPEQGIASRSNLARWALYGVPLFLAALLPLVVWGDELSTDSASAPMTMAFVIMALGTVVTGLALRRDPESGLTGPWGKAPQLLVWPVVLTVASTELGFLQRWLQTTHLDAWQWGVCLALTAVVLAVVEGHKAVLRKRLGAPATRPTVAEAVAPARGR
ncbi:cation-translocating P-type ATPase [Demequina flava]|uniref:cation-translocating P-type ATPase n=1 Tax=Demequina flava TaxID=1095025 RepID=UPI000782693E|nr:cation-transporting P-type ATPase [Demequina flava]